MRNSFLFDDNCLCIVPDRSNINYLGQLLFSKIALGFLTILNPTLAFQVGSAGDIPIFITEDKSNKDYIDKIYQDNIVIYIKD